jgi:hypothetical protein
MRRGEFPHERGAEPPSATDNDDGRAAHRCRRAKNTDCRKETTTLATL